jgi:farnesol dehydrogenase
MEGCQAVFHCAALVGSWVPHRQEFYTVNVRGLRNIVAAAKAAGVGTVIYTSSFFALGPAPPPGAREDSGLQARLRHPYQHSKFLARLEARRTRSSGFPIVIVYPGVLYGPGRRTLGNVVSQLISDFMAGKVPGLLGDGSQVWSYSFVEDVARGHLLAWRKSPSGGEFVLGGENRTLREFFSTLGKLVGRPAPALRIPAAVGALAGGIGFLFQRLRGRAPTMTSSAVRLMYENWALDSSRAESELGYARRPLEDGLLRTLTSMQIPTRTPGDLIERHDGEDLKDRETF